MTAALKLIPFICILTLASFYKTLNAEETDQFTLPPAALIDTGPIASEMLYEVLKNLINKTNGEIAVLLSKKVPGPHSTAQLKKRLKDVYLADLLYEKCGPGFPRWLRQKPFIGQREPMQYKAKWVWDTVYWLVFSQSPIALIRLAPTINMYEHYFGMDKLAHFFMQGHTYYKVYRFLLNHGKTPEEAQASLLRFGQLIEATYLGTLINGIYSNGDLSANFAGWKFYWNLSHPVRIGQHIHPPILVLHDNTWDFSPHIKRHTLLEPYLSDNLNEAWNPSHYSFMRGQIQRQVKKRCNDWIQKKGLTEEQVLAKLKETQTWHGEAYGHWLPVNKAVTLRSCFGGR